MSAMTISTDFFTSERRCEPPNSIQTGQKCVGSPSNGTSSWRLSSQRLVGWRARRVSPWLTTQLESLRSHSRPSADEGATEKFRSGRLTSALEYSGFGPLEHVCVPVSPGNEHNREKRSPGKKGRFPKADGRLRQRRELAEHALRDRRRPRPDATQALKEQENELVRLEPERDERGAASACWNNSLRKRRSLYRRAKKMWDRRGRLSERPKKCKRTR